MLPVDDLGGVDDDVDDDVGNSEVHSCCSLDTIILEWARTESASTIGVGLLVFVIQPF